MSETIGTKQVNAEIQIHITGISIAAPIGGEMQATANFTKALVDPDTGDFIESLSWNADEDGLQQVNLDQITILGLVTPDRFDVIRDSLHEKRKAPLAAQGEE